MTLYVIAGLVVLLLVFMITTYNSLVKLRQRVQNAWSQVDVQLKRRYDLIPNLVNTVKGYAAHERETLEGVTRARTMAMESSGVANQANAENMLSRTLKSLFALAENYPELKANENFLNLQRDLTDTEGKIAFARQFYNDTVQKFNTKIELFPTNLLAGWFGFAKADYFTLQGEPEARQAVNVDFK